MLVPWKKSYDKLSILKSRDITLSTKVHIIKAMVFPVVMYECESWTEESWAPKNWRFWTVVLEKTLESFLDCKEIKPVNPQGNQSWIFIGRHAEAETPILWLPGVKNWLIGKVPDVGGDWRQEKGMTEDEMVGWHHWLNGHEFVSGASVRNSTRDKVMQQSSDGKANQTSGFPPGISWASTP